MGQGTSREPSGSARPTGEASGGAGERIEVGDGSHDIDDCDSDVEVDITVLLKDWETHAAYGLWKQTEDRGLITCKQYITSIEMWKLEHESNEFRTMLQASPLYSLVDASYGRANRVLVCGFIERWHPETNTFHLLFGEMTITLDDIHCITGLPVSGKAVNCEIPSDPIVFVSELLGIERDLVEEEFNHCGGYKVSKSWLKNNIAGMSGCNGITVEQAVRGYLLYLLGCTLMCDRTGDKLKIAYLHMLRDLDKVNEWAWGAATLANLYQQLSKASRMKTVGVAGYLTLLEVWVYEHFPTLRPPRNDGFKEGEMVMSKKWKPIGGMKDEVTLIALRHLREDLDLMTARDVAWNAYQNIRTVSDDNICWYYGCIRTLDIIEPYHPNRVVRQFGNIQSIPQAPIPPKKSSRSGSSREYNVTYSTRDDDFHNYLNHLVHASKCGGKARFDYETTDDYIKWYRSVAVRRLTGVSKRKQRHSREDDESKKKVVSAIDDVIQNHSKKSKKDMLKVFNMAYEFLVAGVCTSADPVDIEAEEEEVPAERAPKRPRAPKKK